jgi:hypothetical protein
LSRAARAVRHGDGHRQRAHDFEFAPGTARIVCERPCYDRRAVMTALGLG